MSALQKLLDQIRSDAFDIAHDPVLGGLRHLALSRAVLTIMEDCGSANNCEIAFYKHERGNVAAEIHAFDFDAEDDVLALYFVIDANESDTLGADAVVTPVSKEAINRGFRRLEAFVRLCEQGKLDGLEPSQSASEVVEIVRQAEKTGTKIELNVVATGPVSERAAVSSQSADFPREVWDLNRLDKLAGSSAGERPDINFFATYGVTLPSLVTPRSSDGLQVIMSWMTGDVLAEIYNTYRSRLLERNVRSFLQFTGKVNKNIRATVISEPERFLSYNNGLSATASEVEFDDHGSGLARIRAVKEFQIVNGGQTTASIASCARKDDVDVSKVLVAMKLTVVPHDHIEQFVPLISQYANTQNRIQAADFSANHPWHIELERLSRSTWLSPSMEAPRGVRWYYERSRGQYADDLANQSTPVSKKRFRTENPSTKKLTKTDVAKFIMSWEQAPFIVSKGAQKCFLEFMQRIQRERRPPPDASDFRRIVALAILFKTAERIHTANELGDWRAPTVTYTIARLSHALARRLPWEEIWALQALPGGIRNATEVTMKAVHDTIVRPPAHRSRNAGEWSKKEECWSAVLDIPIDFGDQFERQEAGDRYGDAPSEPVIRAVCSVPTEVWYAVASWAKETNTLQPWQRRLSFGIGQLRNRGKNPSIKQAIQGRTIVLECVRLGFGHDELPHHIINELAQANPH